MLNYPQQVARYQNRDDFLKLSPPNVLVGVQSKFAPRFPLKACGNVAHPQRPKSLPGQLRGITHRYGLKGSIGSKGFVQLTGLNARQLEFIFCALADLVTGKLLGYMFEQVDPQAAFLTRALGQAEAEREEIFRR